MGERSIVRRSVTLSIARPLMRLRVDANSPLSIESFSALAISPEFMPLATLTVYIRFTDDNSRRPCFESVISVTVVFPPSNSTTASSTAAMNVSFADVIALCEVTVWSWKGKMTVSKWTELKK